VDFLPFSSVINNNNNNNNNLFTQRRIVKGEYSFDSPHWNHVSDIAKDFVKKLLNPNPSQRLSAIDALNHDWIKNNNKKTALHGFGSTLSRFIALNRFQTAVRTVIIAQQWQNFWLNKNKEKKIK